MGMADSNEPSDNLIDARHDNENNAVPSVDASALALAAVFGTISFPPGTPDNLKNLVADRAAPMRDNAGDLVIDNRMDANSPEARQKKADADNNDNLSQFAQIAQQIEAEREREEWMRTKSTVAGVTMTGEEWADLAKRLREDRSLHDKLVETFIKRGMSREEAEARYDRVAELAEAAVVPPSQRTDEQKHVMAEGDADPWMKKDIEAAKANIAASV